MIKIIIKNDNNPVAKIIKMYSYIHLKIVYTLENSKQEEQILTCSIS